MRQKAMFDSSVVCSEGFEGLSVEAQLLYFKLNYEASNIGEIVRVEKRAQLFDCGERELSELISARLLVEVDGRCFIRHYFVHNRLSSGPQKKAAHAAFASVGGLEFEGEPFRSPFSMGTSDDGGPSAIHLRSIGDASQMDRRCIGANVNVIESNPEKLDSITSQSKREVRCPTCGSNEHIVQSEYGMYTCSCGVAWKGKRAS